MHNYSALSLKIEKEYEEYLRNPSKDLNALYESLLPYLERVITIHIRNGNYVDEDAVAEIAQEALLTIAERGIDSFERRGARFATYCGVIAQRRAVDWVRKQNRLKVEWGEEIESLITRSGRGINYSSPEKQILEYERILEQIALVKKYLKLLMDWPQKPYRTVSCGFTMVLFQRYHPTSKELTSPRWAFDTVKENTVAEGAERFISEMQEWFPKIPFAWSEEFLNAMDEEENGMYVRDIVFGERFQAKDFENWSRRLQPRIKKCLFEASVEEICL